MNGLPPDSGGSPGERDRLDTLFAVLADHHRRQVVHYFRSAEDDAASVEDLVEYVVEQDGPIDDRERIAIKFHHATLPQLADAGIIEYDGRSDTVRYRGQPQVERLLDCVSETPVIP